jgi:hypothetical protein
VQHGGGERAIVIDTALAEQGSSKAVTIAEAILWPAFLVYHLLGHLAA